MPGQGQRTSLAWMTLKSSVVIFQALKPLQSQWPQWFQQPPWPQWPQQLHFIKKFTDPKGLIIPCTQMTYLFIFVYWLCERHGMISIKWHVFTSFWSNQTWSNLIKHDQTWSTLIKLDQTWSNCWNLGVWACPPPLPYPLPYPFSNEHFL